MKFQRFVIALVGMGLVLSLGVLLRDRQAAAGPVPEVVRAQSFELVDADGQVRATLEVAEGPTEEVVLRLRDADGTLRVKLGASENGSGLLLANEKTGPGVHILAKKRTFVLLERGDNRRVIRP